MRKFNGKTRTQFIRSFKFSIVSLLVGATALLSTGCKKAGDTGNGGSGTPTPTASPQPTQNPRTDLSPSCRQIAEGTGTGLSGCKAQDNKFLPYLMAAQAGVSRSFFNGAGQVYDVPGYADAIIEFLDQTHHLCAFWDGQKMMVRDSSNSNEYYRLFSPNRVADPFLLTTCAPAKSFGTRNNALDPYPGDPTCSLPRSNEDENTTCQTANGALSPNRNQMAAALEAVFSEQRTNPTFLVFKDDKSPAEWVKKDKEQAYLARVAEKLKEAGYCASPDGGQGLSLKKGSNAYSEFWALRVLGQEDLDGSHPTWRKFHSTCSPAEF